MDNINLNIPKVTITQVVELLSTLYVNAIKGNVPLKTLPTPFLWGPGGVGKSAGIFQLAEYLRKLTNKKVNVTDVRLLLYSPMDLLGVPVPDKEHGLAKWLKPAVFDMDKSDDCINILFLDELSAASQSIQAAAYQICLDRKVGEHRLPDNCIVVAAGNRTSDQSVSYKMPKALCNRLMHFDVGSDFASWRAWAVRNLIDSRIIGFLAFDNSRLYCTPQPSDFAYPTPRSWHFLSTLLKTTDAPPRDIHQLICGCVGTDTAVEFEHWCDMWSKLPSMDDVLNGVCTKYPDSYDLYYALVSGISTTIVAHKDTITVTELNNVCAYASRFPADFAMTLFDELHSFEELRSKLMKCSSLSEWLRKNKRSLRGATNA